MNQEFLEAAVRRCMNEIEARKLMIKMELLANAWKVENEQMAAEFKRMRERR